MKATTTTITTAERRAITEAILNTQLFRGLDRTKTKGEAISALCCLLDRFGFNLQMVPGDIIMGDHGQRNLSFSRHDEEQSVENATIHFGWENLSGSFWTDHNSKRYEFIAYVS